VANREHTQANLIKSKRQMLEEWILGQCYFAVLCHACEMQFPFARAETIAELPIKAYLLSFL
jgi:hypothetical protein